MPNQDGTTPTSTELRDSRVGSNGHGAARGVDPTENVRELVDLNVRRIDDLRIAEVRRIDDLRNAESRRVDEQSTLRAHYEQQLRDAESERINAIRSVDVNAVAVASERAGAQANVLATQVSQSAEALRALVASTASTIAAQQAQSTGQLTDRVALVEKTQYEGAGRRTQEDPAMAALLAEVKALSAARSATGGNQQMVGWIVSGVLAVVAIAGTLFGVVSALRP